MYVCGRHTCVFRCADMETPEEDIRCHPLSQSYLGEGFSLNLKLTVDRLVTGQ